MVHVWSINSGERFQGHHGPLVFFFFSIRIISEIAENIMGKGENTGYQHFFLSKVFFLRDSLKLSQM